MPAGPDRIRISRDLEGLWAWEYRANGRTVATSEHGYTERAACLHGLHIVTGVSVRLPDGWRGTQESPYWGTEVFTHRPDPIIVQVWDSYYVRQGIARRRADREAEAQRRRDFPLSGQGQAL